MDELLDLWTDQNEPTWAVSTAQNQKCRVAQIKNDPIAKVRLVRLTAVDVDRSHARMARSGVGEGSIRNQHHVLRAAVTRAVWWGWVTTNVVTVALRAAVTGARRSELELAALRWDDLEGNRFDHRLESRHHPPRN